MQNNYRILLDYVVPYRQQEDSIAQHHPDIKMTQTMTLFSPTSYGFKQQVQTACALITHVMLSTHYRTEAAD